MTGMKTIFLLTIILALINMPKDAIAATYKVINPSTTVLESEWLIIQDFLNQSDSHGVSNGDKYFYGSYNPESFDMNAFVTYTTKYNKGDNVEYKQITRFNISDILLINGQKFSGTLNLDGLSELSYVYASGHSISQFTMSRCPNIKWVFLANNELINFNINSCSQLELISLSSNNLTSVNTDYPANLKYVSCDRNFIRSLDSLRFNKENLTNKTFKPQKMNMPSGNLTASDYDILPEYNFDKSQFISTAFNANNDEELYYLPLNANGSFKFASNAGSWNYWHAGDTIYLRLIIPEYLDPETDLEGLAFDLETNVFIVPEAAIPTGIRESPFNELVYAKDKILYLNDSSCNDIFIYTLSGYLVRHYTNHSSATIDLSDMKCGIYIIWADGIRYKILI